MKWANIPKKERREQWHTVNAPLYEHVQEASMWCRAHPSTGRFYNHYTNTRWWFEKEEDALLFALTWSGAKQQRKRTVDLQWQWTTKEK